VKTLCIDLRWIDASGVGVYIKGVLPGIIERLKDTSIVGIGDIGRLKEFPWSHSDNVRLVQCGAGRYSLAEQVQLPLAIPRETSLFWSPYYTIPLFYRGPLAVTVHDMSHLIVDEIVSNPKKRIYAQTMYRAISKRASLIFTVSNFTKTELLRFTTGIRPESIIPTHLGVSPEWTDARAIPSLRSRSYFICVGNVKPYKNIRRLVEAFLKVKDKIQQDLVIVGQKDGLITGESPEFFEKVRQAGDRIHMTGLVPFRDLLSFVGHADALVMPSLYEGFGLPPVEAMAAGVPVVVAQAGSLPEVCGDAALYFNPLQEDEIAAKLIEIATQSSLRERLRKEGLEQSRRYQWSRCAEITADTLLTRLDRSG
jgi:glycosyltransferase involved in cell wall biosynthesis